MRYAGAFAAGAVLLAVAGDCLADDAHIIAAVPCYEDGRMIANVHRPIPYAAGKVHRVWSCERHVGELGERAESNTLP